MVLMFNVVVPSSQFVSGCTGPAAVQTIQQQYGVSVVVRVQQKQFRSVYTSGSVKQLVTVRGSVYNAEAITQATSALFELFTGRKMVSLSSEIIIICYRRLHRQFLESAIVHVVLSE